MRITRTISAIVVGATLALSGVAAGHATSSVEDLDRIAMNKAIREWGGIPPCTWEDGAGQPGKCYWNGGANGTGSQHIAVPTMPGHDKRIVILNRQR